MIKKKKVNTNLIIIINIETHSVYEFNLIPIEATSILVLNHKDFHKIESGITDLIKKF